MWYVFVVEIIDVVSIRVLLDGKNNFCIFRDI